MRIFELGIGLRFLKEILTRVLFCDDFPCFSWTIQGCIAVKGIRTSALPKADIAARRLLTTLETVRALGVKKRILVVGMCSRFGKKIQVGDVVVPDSIL